MKPSLHLQATQQLSSIELLAEIQQQLESNPLLEQQGALDTSESSTSTADDDQHDEDWDDLSFSSGNSSSEDDNQPEDTRAAAQTLADHLLWQLQLAHLSELDMAIGYCLIEALDERGYLTTPFADIAQACQQLLGEACPEDSPDDDELLAVLHRIQRFEPTGVAARNLAECLCLQLEALPDTTPFRKEALLLLRDTHQRNNASPLAKLDAQDATGSAILALLRELDPAPGASFMAPSDDYILPDLTVQKRNGRWQVRLNQQLQPRLSINRHYADMAQRTDDSQAGQYLRQQLQEARWFIKSIESRQETLLRVGRCILDLQQGFFDYGPEAMKPLVLADVAERLGLHESTISRVTTQKFMHTPRGLFELKYFFSSHVATDGGGECSSTAIRAIIKKLVTAENPKKPLSDSRLTELLNEQGIQVARRTVAKYREALRIPSSSERKRLL